MAEILVPLWFVLTVAGAYGLVFGSFLNVVVYRLPRGMSLVRPRSHCPACGALVRWYDNVPMLSYVVLLGRCRACRKPISPRYPLVELAAGGAGGGRRGALRLDPPRPGGDAVRDAPAATGVHRPRAPPAARSS